MLSQKSGKSKNGALTLDLPSRFLARLIALSVQMTPSESFFLDLQTWT